MRRPRAPRRVTALTAGLAAALTATVACGTAPAADDPAPVVRNIIFINGDGMAAAQREAGRLSIAGLDGQLEMGSMPVSGQLTTDSRDPATPVTDSAAGASAWATGQKTYNRAVSVDLDGAPLPVLGTAARDSGRATGLVTTAQVTDASPAAFFARTADRDQQDGIALQYLEESRPDVILGGGEDWWYPAGDPGAYPDNPPEAPDEASKSTQGDLVERARELGYDYAATPEQLRDATGPKLLGLFANEEMFQQRPEGQGDVYSPVVDLATMTQKALDVLGAAPDGFFLFVEEEAVDEFAHNNNGPRTLQAMEQLDAAVAVTRRWAETHPDTLIVVTGDHETGGLALEDTDVTDDESGDAESAEDGPVPVADSPLTFVMDWTTTEHTGVPVPVTAQGPRAEEFAGEHPNTWVHEVLTRALEST